MRARYLPRGRRLQAMAHSPAVVSLCQRRSRESTRPTGPPALNSAVAHNRRQIRPIEATSAIRRLGRLHHLASVFGCFVRQDTNPANCSDGERTRLNRESGELECVVSVRC